MATASTQLPEQQPIAQVSDRTRKPEGVVSRRSQQYVIMGIAVVIVLIAMFSSNRQRKPVSAVQSGLAPMVREGNERKVADYGQQLADEQRRAMGQLPPPSNPSATTGYGAGHPVRYQSANTADDEWQQAADRDPLADKERERAYNSRFASNIAYAAP